MDQQQQPTRPSVPPPTAPVAPIAPLASALVGVPPNFAPVAPAPPAPFAYAPMPAGYGVPAPDSFAPAPPEWAADAAALDDTEWESEPPAPLLIAAMVAAYVLLAIWGMQLAGPQGITDWFPAAGLAVAAVALGGSRFALAPFLGTLVATPVTAPGVSFTATLLIAATATACYTVGGLALRRSLDLERPLARVQDAWVLIGIGTVAVPLVTAVSTLAALIISGSIPAAWSSTGEFILGDALGIATVTPAMLMAGAAWRRAPHLGSLFPRGILLRPEAIAAIAALVFVTPSIFLVGGEDIRAIAVLPLCWLALRFGVVGAVLGTFTWSASSAILLSLVGQRPELGGLQGFLMTGSMLALIVGSVVSERERTQRALENLAMHDQASGLPNEAKLLDLLADELRDAPGREVTTMLVRFAGLRQVAANLRPDDTQLLVDLLVEQLGAIAGPNAIIARPGFDRFALLISGATGERRQQIAERIADELSAPLRVESLEVFVDPRVGITVGLPGEAPDAILAHADHAADTATSGDGHRIGYYDAAIERARRERHELAEDLRLATERGELLLAFQPIVTAKEGRVVAAEALLRWVDRRRGPVSPADFVPVAEETGLILPIGRWVLNEACSRATQWPHVAGQAIGVSVNISPIQLMDDRFVDDVKSALERSGLPAERLRIEITEGIVLEDIDRTIQQIQQLRDMGVETMLDDFGTGHSSLAWVQRLPVSCIKIDRAFVGDIAQDGIDRAIVHASLYLSRALGTETVAEGVETEAQREQLVRMGCQKLQGYLFARPQPADVFPDWLAKQRAREMRPEPVTAHVPAPAGLPPHASAPTTAQQEAWSSPAAPARASTAPRAYAPSNASGPRPVSGEHALRPVPAIDPRFAA